MGDDRAAAPGDAFPVNMREGVIWAYRHLLRREPPTEAEVRVHMVHDARSLTEAFLVSAEYAAREPAASARAVLAGLAARFAPFASEAPPPGYWRNFLGVDTRCCFLPESCRAWSGQLFGPPGSGASGPHDDEEWEGTLRSVLAARDSFTAVELGAGWAPWLVSAGRAAERAGIGNVRLVGIEGSLGHVAFMRQHFRDNGLDPDRHRLVHGVVGTRDGTAFFPRLPRPSENYGAQADYARCGDREAMEEVPCLSLPTLLAGLPRVDILHCDVQGAEADLFRNSREVVDRTVARAVVGTHGRSIEAALHAEFAGRGWVLEADTACRFAQVAGHEALVLVLDGTQVWRNPRLPPA